MYNYIAEIVRVIDGDTLQVNIDLGLSVHVNTTIRLYGVNAPEARTVEGDTATVFVRMLVQERGPIVHISTYKDHKEKYGRYLGIIHWEGNTTDLGAELIANGHAVPYEA